MDRKKVTKFLGALLRREKLGDRTYWASEVSIDYGTTNVRRVDFMAFKPAGVTCVSDLEKGSFTCYEVKSCVEDVYSGNGLNFLGERNYIVTTMDCYKKILDDYNSCKLDKHIQECFPESSLYYGIMVAIPTNADEYEEFSNPTEIDFRLDNWKFKTMMPCRGGRRKRSMAELLFCLLRSGH